MLNYNVNWRAFAEDILPPRWRLDRFISYVYVLLFPVAQLHQAFLDWRDEQLLKLSFGPQVLTMERMLNLSFTGSWVGDGSDPIYITEQSQASVQRYLYQESETERVYMPIEGEADTAFLFLESEIQAVDADWLINVPTGYSAQELSQMEGLVDKYRIAGPSYVIVEYS